MKLMKAFLSLLLAFLLVPTSYAATTSSYDFIDKIYQFFQDKPEYDKWQLQEKTNLLTLIHDYASPDTQKQINDILSEKDSVLQNTAIDEFLFQHYADSPDPFLITPFYIMMKTLGEEYTWSLQDFVVYSDMQLKYTDIKDITIYSLPTDAKITADAAVELAIEDFKNTHIPIENFDISNFLFVPSFGVYYDKQNSVSPYYVIEIYQATPEADTAYSPFDERAVSQDGVVYPDSFALEKAARN